METNREQRKELAVKLMKELDIYKPYIEDFRKRDYVTYFERCIGYWDWQKEALIAVRKELEEKYGFTVYAMTHEFFDHMEMWTMLIVPKDEESQDKLLMEAANGMHYAFAYVLNATYPDYSEFGEVLVQSAFGGVRRVA